MPKDTRPKILFCAFEAAPFVKTGGLGDVAGSLPRALLDAGANARLMMPKLGAIPQQYKDRMRHVTDFTLRLAWRQLYCGVEELRLGGVTCYFIDNEYYFKRDAAYGYGDDAERVAFFSLAVLSALPHLHGWFPDVLHCNDWHTAMVPVYLQTFFRENGERYRRLKTVFSIHNLRFQGKFDPWITGDVLGMGEREAEYHGLYRDHCLNMMQGAVVCSDRISTVSPTYANEICTGPYGEGMDDLFRSRRGILTGILNGIDTRAYDPAADKSLPYAYDRTALGGKAMDKAALQRELGLPADPHAPLAVLVSRLTSQKGLDLVLRVCDEMLDTGMQLAILGTGEKEYEEGFAAIAARRENMRVFLRFDEALSHRMFAGADLVLVPSQFEPCGLTQMYGLRYGALPVVRETGGLKDSVIPYNRYTGEGTGFSFANYNAHELLYTVQAAVRLYKEDRPAWDRLVQNAMAQDNSWAKSAARYLALYREVLGK